MHRVLSRRFHRITWRMFVFLIVSTVLTTGNGLSRGAAAANSMKYAHHSPLASALSGRSMHDSGDNSASSVMSRGGDVIEGTGTTNNNNAGGGEVLLPKTFPLGPEEPTCEQLRAMWIFSKRQSRAAEITNEIPTYRDPFAYNVWEPYSTTRSMGAVRMVPRFGERSRSPVFGRVISREPLLPQRINLGQRQRHMGIGVPSAETNQARFYGAESKTGSIAPNGRRTSQYRYVGSNGSATTTASGQPNSVAVQGSFQKLKELIWTERAKELTQQRRAEEMAARAAVLKEIANGQNIQAPYKPLFKSESHLMDENRSPDRDTYEHMNDDHRTGSIASGQSQGLTPTQVQKSQNINSNNNNMKTIGSPRSYINKGQKASSVFSNSNVGRPGRLVLPSMVASSYAMEDTGIPKAYPMRPSHFRERNRSLFKQHSPSDYFQRDIRQKNTYEDEEPAADNLIFARLVNELNRRILAKQHESEASRTSLYPQTDSETKDAWIDDALLLIYEDENPTAIGHFTGSEQLPEYY